MSAQDSYTPIDGCHSSCTIRESRSGCDGRRGCAPRNDVPSPVKVTKEQLVDIAYEIIDTVMRKNADYADAWQAHGKFGALLRIFDKSMRYQNLTQHEAVFMVNETIEDTLEDIIGYALLLLLLMQHEKQTKFLKRGLEHEETED